MEMAATVNTERVIETTVGGGPRPGNGFRKNGGGRFGRDGEPLQFSPSRYRIGAWAGIGGIVMLFTALASAYIVRSASGNDWRPIVMPKVLWLSTAVIVISSVSERGERFRHGVDVGAGIQESHLEPRTAAGERRKHQLAVRDAL